MLERKPSAHRVILSLRSSGLEQGRDWRSWIGQFHHGRSYLFRIPARFDSRRCDIRKRAGHRFLTLQKAIGMLVGRRRQYAFHSHEMSSASHQSRH